MKLPPISKILIALVRCDRAMPAHFTSNGDRKKSFCVDFADLTDADEYQLASDVYYSMGDFTARVPAGEITENESFCVLRIGEDLTIGSFMLQKLDDYASFSTLKAEILKFNIEAFANKKLEEVVKLPMIQNYFDYCILIGREQARTGPR